MAELSHILKVARVSLAEPMQLTVPKLTLEHLLVGRLVKQALTRCFAILPLSLIYVAR